VIILLIFSSKCNFILNSPSASAALFTGTRQFPSDPNKQLLYIQRYT
jgi:hypothetical protein